MVYGAGELNFVKRYGFKLSTGAIAPTQENISEFRHTYLSSISDRANGEPIVTDKMPHNFRFLPLICAAFPEAKIVHVRRNASAICWSNFKQCFVHTGLGYCHDLGDIVTYYNLYSELIEFWQSQYGDRIYNLNYESLTTDQEQQTRKLINHLELNWEDACLSPENNNRSVETASRHQVRNQVYKNSSKEWLKFEPYLNGIFGCLPP